MGTNDNIGMVRKMVLGLRKTKMMYIPLSTFFSIASQIGKCTDPVEKEKLEQELSDLEQKVYSGKALVGLPPSFTSNL